MKKFWWVIRWLAFLFAFVFFVYDAPRWVISLLVMIVVLAWEIARVEEQTDNAQRFRAQAQGDPNVPDDPTQN